MKAAVLYATCGSRSATPKAGSSQATAEPQRGQNLVLTVSASPGAAPGHHRDELFDKQGSGQDPVYPRSRLKTKGCPASGWTRTVRVPGCGAQRNASEAACDRLCGVASQSDGSKRW